MDGRIDGQPPELACLPSAPCLPLSIPCAAPPTCPAAREQDRACAGLRAQQTLLPTGLRRSRAEARMHCRPRSGWGGCTTERGGWSGEGRRASALLLVLHTQTLVTLLLHSMQLCSSAHELFANCHRPYSFSAAAARIADLDCEDSGPGLRVLWNCQRGSYCADLSGGSGEHGGGMGVWHENHTCFE